MKPEKIGSSTTENFSNPVILDFASSLSAEKVTKFLLYVVASLVGLSLLSAFSVHYLPDFPMRDVFAYKFDLDREQSFPALYSSLALFLCSVILFVIARFKSNLKDRYTFYWKALSAIFVYLSLDELLSIHEHLSKPLHNIGINGFFYNAWVIPGFIVLSIFLVLFSRFFFHLPPWMKRSIILSIVLFVGGAMIVELFVGYYKYLYGAKKFGYALLVTLEESMEMLSIVIFINALLRYIHQMGINQVNFGLNLGRKL